VGPFLQDAESILNAAQSAAGATANPTDFTILISPEGGIHMLAESDWPLASLESHYGARTLYRVSQASGQITVEGRSGLARCRLQAEHPQAVARRLLAGPVPCFSTVR
jgi:hypothetical protein